jgi:hypothetical protein
MTMLRLNSFSPIHDFQKSRYENFVPKVNYTVSKEKVTRIKNGSSDSRKYRLNVMNHVSYTKSRSLEFHVSNKKKEG